MYLNKAIICGNLTRDPEVKKLPSGNMVAAFSVATNRVWKDKDGKKHEEVEYHNLVCFGRQAEIVGEYLFKGSQCLIEGRIQTRSWEDSKSGDKKYRTEVIVEMLQLGNRPKDGGSDRPTRPSNAKQELDEAYPDEGRTTRPAKKNSHTGRVKTDIEYPEDDINPEDIPF